MRFAEKCLVLLSAIFIQVHAYKYLNVYGVQKFQTIYVFRLRIMYSTWVPPPYLSAYTPCI